LYLCNYKEEKLQTSMLLRLRHIAVWLRRITHTRGFGIQSPTDYWIERYVINEHSPYYSYQTIGQNDDWLKRKLGRLYFRIANWCQPNIIYSDHFLEYLHAGCQTATLHPLAAVPGASALGVPAGSFTLPPSTFTLGQRTLSTEGTKALDLRSLATIGTQELQTSNFKLQTSNFKVLARLDIDGNHRQQFSNLLDILDQRSVLIVEGIQRDKHFWQEIVAHQRTGVTFDLYYCGLVLFDKKRIKKNYIINF
jgi:hypothetical protein